MGHNMQQKTVLLVSVLSGVFGFASAWFQDDWSVAKLSSEPEFPSPSQNVTIAAGREAILTCSVRNLGRYKEYPVEESVEGVLITIQDDPSIKCVIVAMDLNITFIMLQKALTYLKRDDCTFLTSGTDMRIPIGSIGPLIGTGHFSRIISSVSHREPTSVAKPSLLTCSHVNRKLGIRMPNRVLFIGDYISQDMQTAAMGGYQKLLVLSGHTQLKDLQNWTHPEEWKPQYYVEDLNTLYNVIRNLD